MTDRPEGAPRHPYEDRLLQAAAAALKKRRELDREIARLVARPLDPEATERVRDAQEEASQAGSMLDQERTAYESPVGDPAIDDPQPRTGESSWHG